MYSPSSLTIITLFPNHCYVRLSSHESLSRTTDNSFIHSAYRLQYLVVTHNEEWDPSKRRELLAHPTPPSCLFTDIGDFFVPAIKAILPQLRSGNLIETKLMPLVMSDKAVQTFL